MPHNSVTVWVEENSVSCRHGKGVGVAPTTHQHTKHTHNTTITSWRLIQSQRVPLSSCCQAQVCSVTLWGRGNYILVQSGNSASIQRVLSVPSSYRPQTPEECPALDTLLWTNTSIKCTTTPCRRQQWTLIFKSKNLLQVVNYRKNRKHVCRQTNNHYPDTFL